MARKKRKSAWTDYERLTVFADEAEGFSKTRLLSHDQVNFGCEIRVSTFGTTVKESTVDEDDLRAFLMGLRPFLSRDEPVFLHSIYKICERLIPDEQVLSY